MIFAPVFFKVCPSKMLVNCFVTEPIPYTVWSVTGSFVSEKKSIWMRINLIFHHFKTPAWFMSPQALWHSGFSRYAFLSDYLTDLYTGKSKKKNSSKIAPSWDWTQDLWIITLLKEPSPSQRALWADQTQPEGKAMVPILKWLLNKYIYILKSCKIIIFLFSNMEAAIFNFGTLQHQKEENLLVRSNPDL